MKQLFSTPKRGFVVKDDGKLYEFKRNSITVSKAWPPVRYQKTRKKPFWHYSPTHKISLHYTALKYSVEIEKGILEDDFWARYALPAVAIQDDPRWQKSLEKQRKWTPVIASFYDRIPLKVRGMMLANTKGAWNICALYARCPGAEEIMRNSPAIGFMLSNFPVFRPKLKRKWNAVRRIMTSPRRRIISWLGWPDSEAVAKILSKIPYSECSNTGLLMLRALLKKSPSLIKPMSHLKGINAASLSIICRNSHRSHASWSFLGELGILGRGTDESMSGNAFELKHMFNDTLSMEKRLLLSRGPFQSIEHLIKRHRHVITECKKLEISELEESNDLPCPPVPVPAPGDDFEIYPVDTPLKLYNEAEEQHNCVCSYIARVEESDENIYIYSMRKPERATIAIELDHESGIFLPLQVKGPFDKTVSGETLSKIIIWLAAIKAKMPPVQFDENAPDRRLPAFPVPVPKADGGFMVRQITSLKSLVSEMLQYNMNLESNTMKLIEQGKTFAFLMDAPDKALVLVTKGKGGEFTYAVYKKIRTNALNHHAERFLEQWMEEATVKNLVSCNPDQLDFRFSGISAYHMEQESSACKLRIRQFLRFLPQTYTNMD